MGIAVYEQAPDAATLLIAGGGTTTATEEEAEEAAEAALSTVDSEFGRTTDPVRMYMREMGTVELLTREGRDRDRQAHRRRPAGDDAGHQRLADHHRRDPELADRIAAGEMQISEVVDGFVRRRRGRRLRRRGGRRRVRRGRRRRRPARAAAKALTKKLEELEDAGDASSSRCCAAVRQNAQGVRGDGYQSPAYRPQAARHRAS